jgi:hypothetical protein
MLRKMGMAFWVVAVTWLLGAPAASSASTRPDPDEQRGCCSHHHGVCGCSGGRTVCCDDTFSPSCTC